MSAAAPPFFSENTWSASAADTSSVLWRLPVSISRLMRLLDEGGEDDHGQIGPSQYAFRTAFLMVFEATVILGQDVSAAPVVDSQGGIRITWNYYNKQVKLVCPANNDASVYIYQSSPAGDSLRNQDVTSAVLAERLVWLCSRESAAAG